MTVSRADAGSRSGTDGSERPDLVDLMQLSKRLRMVPREVTKLNKQGIVAGPHYVVARQEVWYWPHVELGLRKRSAVQRRRPALRYIPDGPAPDLDLVGIVDVAARLGIPAATIRNRLRTGGFPLPDYRFNRTEAWMWATIEAWHAEQEGDDEDPAVHDGRPFERYQVPEPVARPPFARPPIATTSFPDLLAKFDTISARFREMEMDLTPDAEPGRGQPG